QNAADKCLLEDVALFIEKDKEECLVLDNGSADAATILVPIFIILRDAVEVVKPIARVERGIAIGPEQASAELVGSGSCAHLHLPGTARSLGVHGSRDHANFLDEVGAGVGRGERSETIPAVRHDETVACHVRLADTAAGKVAGPGGGEARRAG